MEEITIDLALRGVKDLVKAQICATGAKSVRMVMLIIRMALLRMYVISIWRFIRFELVWQRILQRILGCMNARCFSVLFSDANCSFGAEQKRARLGNLVARYSPNSVFPSVLKCHVIFRMTWQVNGTLRQDGKYCGFACMLFISQRGGVRLFCRLSWMSVLPSDASLPPCNLLKYGPIQNWHPTVHSKVGFLLSSGTTVLRCVSIFKILDEKRKVRKCF